jgi:hypothetical protein
MSSWCISGGLPIEREQWPFLVHREMNCGMAAAKKMALLQNL